MIENKIKINITQNLLSKSLDYDKKKKFPVYVGSQVGNYNNNIILS